MARSRLVLRPQPNLNNGPRKTMRSYSSQMVMVTVLGLVPALCCQEPTPGPAGNQTAPASQPPSPLRTDALPAAASPGATTPSAASPAAPFGEIAGAVKSGNVPLPGVTVTAANT